MAETLRDLGAVVDHPAPNVYEVAAGDVDWLFVPLEAAAKMRASFMLLGPLLTRFGEVIISNPGGDRIGRRPVDLHVDAMRALGADIDYRYGYYYAKAPGRLRGAEVRFPFVSVMGTENAMLAATLADGHTVIRPAAQEPEVDDLIAFLRKMGADVERTAPDTIEIQGKRRLRGADHSVRPRPDRGRDVRDRGGDDRRPGDPRWRALRPPRRPHRGPRADGHRNRMRRGQPDRGRDDRRSRSVRAGRYRDGPVPGPRDGPPAADERPPHPGERPVHRPRGDLRGPPRVDDRAPRMGATIDLPDAHHAIIDGPAHLVAADVEISDLRAGASLILAALAADGTSTIHGGHHVRRGYENIERKFLDLGARIERVQEGEPGTPA